MFHFRLQRVLELREQREKEQAVAFAEAERNADVAREEQAKLRTLHSESTASMMSARSSDGMVGHLQNIGFVLGQLDERLAKSAERVAELEGVVAGARAELDTAARDRRVLGRLKEKHQDVHRVEEAGRDRVLMDEIALGRFTRASTKTTEGVTEG
jgi:flagellar FliJ protein